jgi:hypothetical protein
LDNPKKHNTPIAELQKGQKTTPMKSKNVNVSDQQPSGPMAVGVLLPFGFLKIVFSQVFRTA